MFDDFCSDCQFRQGPMMQPMAQGGCGGQMPMQGSMGIPSMPMPTNIYQQAPGMGSMGMPSQMPFSGQSQMPYAAQSQITPMQTPQIGPSPIPGATFPEAPGSPVFQDIGYMQGYLRTQVGRYVKIEFLIGTNMLMDREGTLLDVGISYVVIREAETDDNVMCDIYSIKFVKTYY